VVSYFLNCYVTFRRPPQWRTFLLFPLSNVANFVITTVGLRVAVAAFDLDQRIAPLVVALIAIPITYVVAHHIMLGRLGGVGPTVEDDAETVGVTSRPPLSRTDLTARVDRGNGTAK
jgi:ABC-type spermidine/putrescine transport system permease subunit II